MERLRKRKEKNEYIRMQRLEQSKIINNIKELLKKIQMVKEHYEKQYKHIDNGDTQRFTTNIINAIKTIINHK